MVDQLEIYDVFFTSIHVRLSPPNDALFFPRLYLWPHVLYLFVSPYTVRSGMHTTR